MYPCGVEWRSGYIYRWGKDASPACAARGAVIGSLAAFPYEDCQAEVQHRLHERGDVIGCRILKCCCHLCGSKVQSATFRLDYQAAGEYKVHFPTLLTHVLLNTVKISVSCILFM